MNSTANVIVEIEDINDNNPEFERESYTADISETAPSGNWCGYWPRNIQFKKNKHFFQKISNYLHINLEKKIALKEYKFSAYF